LFTSSRRMIMKGMILGCVLALLSMTTLVPQAPAAGAPDPLFPAGLDWKPGPICTYDINHNGKKARWTFTVSEVSGDQTRGAWSRDVGGSTVSVPVVKTEKGLKFTEDLSMVHGTPMKAWEGRSVVSGTDATNKPWKVDVTFTSKVSDWEKVKIPAGDTFALRIVSDEKIVGLSGNFSGTARNTYWLGSGACSLKKLEYKNSFRETASLVLVSESSR
jgi:hypothetical protein